MVDKVKIPQWLAYKVEEVKQEFDGYLALYNLVEGKLHYTLDSTNKLNEYSEVVNRYSLRQLAEIIEGNYIIIRDYIGINEVFELKAGSIVRFDCEDDKSFHNIDIYVKGADNVKWLVYEDDEYVSLENTFLQKRWYIVKEVE